MYIILGTVMLVGGANMLRYPSVPGLRQVTTAKQSLSYLITLSYIRSHSVTTSISTGKLYTETDRKEVRKEINI
jgi:hypothetical protein